MCNIEWQKRFTTAYTHLSKSSSNYFPNIDIKNKNRLTYDETQEEQSSHYQSLTNCPQQPALLPHRETMANLYSTHWTTVIERDICLSSAEWGKCKNGVRDWEEGRDRETEGGVGGRRWQSVSCIKKKKKKKRSERNQCSESWGDTARNALWTQVLPKSCCACVSERRNRHVIAVWNNTALQ